LKKKMAMDGPEMVRGLASSVVRGDPRSSGLQLFEGQSLWLGAPAGRGAVGVRGSSIGGRAQSCGRGGDGGGGVDHETVEHSCAAVRRIMT